MIVILALFGTLMVIGTIADGILNILQLEIIPEKFLQVNFSIYKINLTIFYCRFSKVSQLTVTH